MDLQETRAKLRKFDATQLRDALDETWTRRTELERAAAVITEELVGRAIKDNFPSAHTVLIVEDRSHDAPHGHFHSATAEDGTLLVEGLNTEWHERSYSNEIDEYVYDLYTLAGSRFEYDPQMRTRIYRFAA